MVWIILVALVIIFALCCAIIGYRDAYVRREKLSEKRLKAFESGRKTIDALNREICEMRIKHKTNISHLNAQLENERFSKGVFEQRWKNAEEELMKLRESLPKRDSKGRFCKIKEE